MPRDSDVQEHLEAARLNNLGCALLSERQIDTGVVMLQRAVSMAPRDLRWITNLAVALAAQHDVATASNILKQVLEQDPKNFAAWHAYAQVCRQAGLLDYSAKCFEKTLSLGDSPEASYNYTMLLLCMGDYENGFKRYESRLEWRPERQFSIPKWDGQTGQHVYVWAEQGVGDTVQFSRFLPWLAERSRKVTLGLPANLFGMFGGFGSICDLEILGSHSDADFHCPIMSLGYHYGLRRDDVPGPSQLFGATIPHFVSMLRGYKRVGLIWTGNLAYRLSHERAIPFGKLLRAAGNSHYKFYSLQVGEPAKDLAAARAQALVTDLCPKIEGSWDELVQELRDLDLLICTDCGPAHVAGSLGVPTWLLVNNLCDWRWYPAVPESVWYPSVRLFRQQAPGDWDSVMDQVLTALEEGLDK